MQDRNKDVQNESTSSNKQENVSDDSLHGRVDHTANPQFKKEEEEADISQVDRQEGAMHNGELGGNFDDDESKGQN